MDHPIVHDMKLITCYLRTELYFETERFGVDCLSFDPKILTNELCSCLVSDSRAENNSITQLTSYT